MNWKLQNHEPKWVFPLPKLIISGVWRANIVPEVQERLGHWHATVLIYFLWESQYMMSKMEKWRTSTLFGNGLEIAEAMPEGEGWLWAGETGQLMGTADFFFYKPWDPSWLLTLTFITEKLCSDRSYASLEIFNSMKWTDQFWHLTIFHLYGCYDLNMACPNNTYVEACPNVTEVRRGAFKRHWLWGIHLWRTFSLQRDCSHYHKSVLLESWAAFPLSSLCTHPSPLPLSAMSWAPIAHKVLAGLYWTSQPPKPINLCSLKIT
jgi:hypothetical protein